MILCMFDLESYVNEKNNETDLLIKVALLHYQLETTHPFLDENGRVGRLLITLFLLKQKILSDPAIYISYFLKKNRIEYYDRMMKVRKRIMNHSVISFNKLYVRCYFNNTSTILFTG